MRKILKKDFFNQDTTTVAQELLGKFLVRKNHSREIAVMITETEAYDGLHDLASHASKGQTKRTKVMFGHPGNFYMYLCYGVHTMVNIVTREKGYPAAVLIRGAVSKKTVLDGPGKVTKFLGINRTLNGRGAKKSTNLWFEDRGFNMIKFKKLPRIGVTYAGSIWSAKKLRFVVEKVN